MLTKRPYSRLPLHVRIFTERAWALWRACDPVADAAAGGKKKRAGADGILRYGPFKPLPPTIDVALDRGGVDGKAVPTGEGRPRAIDVSDAAFRSAHWEKWTRCGSGEMGCGMCGEPVNTQVRSDTAVFSRRHAI